MILEQRLILKQVELQKVLFWKARLWDYRYHLIMKLNWNCSMKNTQHISCIHISMRNLLVSTCLSNHNTVAYNNMLIESRMLKSILKGLNVQSCHLPMWYYTSTLPVIHFFSLWNPLDYCLFPCVSLYC